jgi:hypothetical protein
MSIVVGPVTTGPKDPSPEELVAIAAALEMAWPKHTVDQDMQKAAEDAWKFANRWWQGSHLMTRRRPRR